MHGETARLQTQFKDGIGTVAPTELITVEGKEHRVRKRYQFSYANRILTPSFLVGTYAFGAIFPPTLASVLTAQGIVWAFKSDEHVEQVKGKIINHLKKELDDRKPAIKSQCMDNFRSILESQVENFRAALVDKRKALKERIKDLQQKIEWLNQVTDFQDQLQQEVKPSLDRFYTMYLH